MVRPLRGDFEQGWAEFEWRWKCEGFNTPDRWQPRWQGEPIAGRRILIFTEQGLGDTFHFIRYAKLLKQCERPPRFWCGRPGLLRASGCCGCSPSRRRLSSGQRPADFDAQVPMLSLPHAFGTTLDTIPTGKPYLVADPELVDRWRERLGDAGGLKSASTGKAIRNIGATRGVDPARVICAVGPSPRRPIVQPAKGLRQRAVGPGRFCGDRSGPELDEAAGPFMDTAAVIKNLDLVITSDTALPHLAGGLGVPTWVALPFVPDWRGFWTARTAPGIRRCGCSARHPPATGSPSSTRSRRTTRRVYRPARTGGLTAGRPLAKDLPHWAARRLSGSVTSTNRSSRRSTNRTPAPCFPARRMIDSSECIHCGNERSTTPAAAMPRPDRSTVATSI